jgi:uncharacterized protein (TIGR02145 family)
MKNVSLYFILILGFGHISFAQTVTIGTQVWMTQNLNVDKFSNGDPIPEAKTPEEWKKAGELKQPAWCYYDNDTANGSEYGKLYNWYAVNDPRDLAPVGYYIPSDEEWTILTDYLFGESNAGALMKSKNGWYDNGNGTNSSGFSGLPGGLRIYTGTFLNIGYFGMWWSLTEHNAGYSWSRHLNYFNGVVTRSIEGKEEGYSVRCLRAVW